MNNTGHDGHGNDEFECSECDFKCSSENDIIKHSIIHKCPTNSIGHPKAIESCITMKYEPDESDNYHRFVEKIEPFSFEEIAANETYENEAGNKKLKVENMHIEPTFIPDQSYFQLNKHNNIHYEKYGNKKLHSEYNSANIFTTDGILKTTNNCDISGSLSNLSEPSQNSHGFLNSSQGLTPWEITSARTHRIEVEVDNTDIYIPSGWTRKLYMRTGPYNGHRIKYDCCYFTELGNKIRRKENAHDYLIKNTSAIEKIDIDKLNFSSIQRMNIDQPNQARLEVDVDNTGIYIPDGWQRKINMSKIPNAEIKYRIIYISPEGKRFWCKPEVYLHIFRSNRSKDKYIDLEKMNFTVTQSCLKEREWKYRTKQLESMPILDNTGVYIPEGWQRVLNMKHSSNNRHGCGINYITPDGKVIQMKARVYTYLSQSDKPKDKDIDVEKMNFSLKSARLPVLNNTGIYIPEGWQRKLYMDINSKASNKCSIYYVTTDGKRLYKKHDTYKYLSHPDRLAEKHIDVEKLDFSIGIQSNRTKRGHSNTEKDNVFDYLLDVRTINRNKSAYTLYLCKLCNYLNTAKSHANTHINEHIQKFGKELTDNCDLPNRYDYFVCTECHGKFLRRKDIQTHLLKVHNSENISGSIFGVRYEYDHKNYIKHLVHCCEVCNFANMKYIAIFKHLKVHTLDEINAADRDKYTHSNEMDENTLYPLHKDGDSGDNDKINNQDMPANKIHSCRSYIKTHGRLQEMEVDNTGKYIPNGWHRKVYRYVHGKMSGYYTVRYISPFGQTLYTASHVPEYIEWLESQGIREPIDVEKFDFSWSSHNLPIKKRNKKGQWN
ncbi:unnamed protein product [Meganyctiphanes norvegica]|uniref:C2H2-type domain-containing protein n=1 Tax=Meganyctiphanes norvegica TaxID=48144 RepID=A0AAV2QPL3_MEGNR